MMQYFKLGFMIITFVVSGLPWLLVGGDVSSYGAWSIPPRPLHRLAAACWRSTIRSNTWHEVRHLFAFSAANSCVGILWFSITVHHYLHITVHALRTYMKASWSHWKLKADIGGFHLFAHYWVLIWADFQSIHLIVTIMTVTKLPLDWRDDIVTRNFMNWKGLV